MSSSPSSALETVSSSNISAKNIAASITKPNISATSNVSVLSAESVKSPLKNPSPLKSPLSMTIPSSHMFFNF